jgi:hypothetical protein
LSEDFFREVGWRIGQRCVCLVWWGWQARGSRSGVAGPDQHLALLVPGKLVHLHDFVRQECEQVVVELKLDLERAIGDTTTPS